MIPIVVFWKNYTATVNGQILKLVPCENCQTEYVYVLEREAMGASTSVYCLNNEGAQNHAVTAADETLQEYLANDFDPVPCPVCGHYQKYMFPKLIETRSTWGVVATIVTTMAGCMSGVFAMYWGANYLERQSDYALWRLIAACLTLAVAGLALVGLSALERARVRRFNPNTEDQQARISKGRSRAVPRVEFEALQMPTT